MSYTSLYLAFAFRIQVVRSYVLVRHWFLLPTSSRRREHVPDHAVHSIVSHVQTSQSHKASRRLQQRIRERVLVTASRHV